MIPINGKKHPWSSNPWVWCVSFRVVEDDKVLVAMAESKRSNA